MPPYDPITNLSAVEAAMRARGVQVIEKRGSRLQRAIDHALRWVSFGRATTYLSSYVTTIGRTIYVPDGWERWPIEARAEVLRHELVHVAQFERWGVVPMALAYLLLPLPIGLAWCRAKLEMEAYEESIRAAAERGGADAVAAMRGGVVDRFIGADYLWMWPFRRSVEGWFDRAAARALRL